MEKAAENPVIGLDMAPEGICLYDFLTREDAGQPRTCAAADVSLNGGKLSLRIFVDVSIIEVYVNGGEKVLTCQAFPMGKAVIAHMECCEMN